jgi:hypothetical protein
MVLAEPVLRSDGLTLVGSGIELTESIIARVSASGAGMVVVEGNPLGGDDAGGDLQALAADLGRMFRRHTANAFMMTLHNMLAEYVARRIAEQRAQEEEQARQRARAAAEAAAAKAAAQAEAAAAGEGKDS